ncbi:MAG: D-alanyl-D-alanine carboxypeptidase/D-alanyl-D-alanine-endopeptidase, partial [Bradymonadaceae bacterium]
SDLGRVRSLDPGDGGTRIRVGGRIGNRSEEVRSRLRIDNPPAFAGSVLRKSLAMVDVTLEGDVRTGSAPDDAEVIVSHGSQPLSYIILAMNKWSNNFMAEQLLRQLGTGDGNASTWKASRSALRDFLAKVGLDPSKLQIKNGSGLYDGNLVSPRQFTDLLTYMLDHRAAPEFLSSLAIAGKDGTLADRMDSEATAGNVRAKTGTLHDVSALSGYVTTASDRRLAFSILFDETPRRAWRYRPVQDEIVKLLAQIDR